MAVIRVGRRATVGRPRLLVLRALGLGDLLTAVPALRALRDGFGEHERILAAPAFLAPLVRLLDGAVDTLVDVDFRVRVGRLPSSLARPDVAVNLHGSGPESHAAVCALDPGHAIAFHDPTYAPDGPPWDDDEHERVRWCRLLTAAGIPADPADHLLRPPADGAPAHFAGATVIHPGASAVARRWPAQRWAAVARDQLRRGHQVVITGGDDEVDLAKSVARDAGIGGEWVVAGQTDLGDLVRLIAVAGRVASGDTGVGHLATALSTPSVAVFGPTSPARWGPPAASGRHVALWAGRDGDPHGQSPDPGLLAVTAQDVIDALADLPGRRP